MTLRGISDWGGPALMLGSAFWVSSVIVHALQPMGCVGDECFEPGRTMRGGSPLGGALLIAAVLLLAVPARAGCPIPRWRGRRLIPGLRFGGVV